MVCDDPESVYARQGTKHGFSGRVGDFQLFSIACGRQDLASAFVVIDQLFDGFDISDDFVSFSLRHGQRTQIGADLTLIDPFDSFLSMEAPTIIPDINKKARDVAIVVFVLIRDLTNADGRRYTALKAQHLSYRWALRCPPLQDTGVKGEAN